MGNEPERIEFLPASIITIEPGDVLVLRTRFKLPAEAIERLRADVERAFGKETRAVVLEDGMSLDVLRKAEVAE
jgi:hypothetical protein